ncbi:ArpU family phage packaging/lysis transcriptional regulator [Paenibacillus harenae]|uniref:ArpU family phage packaging/lysis transcriptional regulator n=1 Tax=Paenibacillus harenae TaxID=306543 RepID=UPI00048FEAF8|nr:ArpU family phage packaging/lysis transcriptional regulator [Paenibacillus harenae]
MKLDFELPELDRKKTQRAVESALDKYRICKYLTHEEREASITAGYNERFHGPTNTTSDQTAQIAIHNVDAPAERKAFCERVERAVRRLHPKERLLIEQRYMREDYEGEYMNDMKVYSFIFNPPISPVTYDKIRWKAFYKLALDLNVEVKK